MHNKLVALISSRFDMYKGLIIFNGQLYMYQDLNSDSYIELVMYYTHIYMTLRATGPRLKMGLIGP